MDRINTATKAVDLYGAGKHGFKNSNATLGTAPTDFNAEWPNGVQEELLGIIEGGGIVAALATLTQVRQAIKRLAGANVRTITAVGPTALTADDSGLIVVDATANAVTITLPAANAVAGVPLEFDIVRSDSSANAVTVNRAGADTFVGGATSFTLTGRRDQRCLRSNSVSVWAVTSSGGNQLLAVSGYRELGGGLIVQWGIAVPVVSPGTLVTWPISFPTACRAVLSGANATSTTYTASETVNDVRLIAPVNGGGNVFWISIGN